MRLKGNDYVYVLVQFILFLFYVLDVFTLNIALPNVVSSGGLIFAGVGALLILVALSQLNAKLSPFPSPKNGSKLIQSGVFRYMRHPIYTGIFLLTLGYGCYIQSMYKIVISVLLLILFYMKSIYEETRLLEMFPEYLGYKKRAGRFFPKKI